MRKGIVAMVLSAAWALFLLVRVRSVFGQRFLLLSGDSVWNWNAEGIRLSDSAFFVLWLLPILGFAWGIWCIVSSTRSEGQIEELDREVEEARRLHHDTVPCPRCAERIRQEARACRFCGHEFGGPVAQAQH